MQFSGHLHESRMKRKTEQTIGLFTLPDSDANSDCKPDSYIVLCRNFHTAPSRIQIPIPTAWHGNGIGIGIRIGIEISEYK